MGGYSKKCCSSEGICQGYCWVVPHGDFYVYLIVWIWQGMVKNFIFYLNENVYELKHCVCFCVKKKTNRNLYGNIKNWSKALLCKNSFEDHWINISRCMLGMHNPRRHSIWLVELMLLFHRRDNVSGFFSSFNTQYFFCTFKSFGCYSVTTGATPFLVILRKK